MQNTKFFQTILAVFSVATTLGYFPVTNNETENRIRLNCLLVTSDVQANSSNQNL